MSFIYLLKMLFMQRLNLSIIKLLLFIKSFMQQLVVLLMQNIQFFIKILNSINRYFIFPFFVSHFLGLNYLWILIPLRNLINFSNFNQLAINFILNEPMNIIFFSKMPNLLGFNFHSINMFRLYVMIICMSREFTSKHFAILLFY